MFWLPPVALDEVEAMVVVGVCIILSYGHFYKLCLTLGLLAELFDITWSELLVPPPAVVEPAKWLGYSMRPGISVAFDYSFFLLPAFVATSL